MRKREDMLEESIPNEDQILLGLCEAHIENNSETQIIAGYICTGMMVHERKGLSLYKSKRIAPILKENTQITDSS